MWKYKVLVIVVVITLMSVGILATKDVGSADIKSDSSEKVSETESEFLHNAAYIKFDGVDGEAQDKDHKGWSDLLSFQQGITNRIMETRIGKRQVDPELGDIVVTKELDKATPKLAEAVCKGKEFAKVEIHLVESYTDSGGKTYYEYELKNVIVVSYSVGHSTEEDVPTESMSLNFEEIKVTYTEHDNAGKSKGKVEYSWKVEEAES